MGVMGSRAGMGPGAWAVCFLLALELGSDREPLPLVSLWPLIEWWLLSCFIFYQKVDVFRKIFSYSVACCNSSASGRSEGIDI